MNNKVKSTIEKVICAIICAFISGVFIMFIIEGYILDYISSGGLVTVSLIVCTVWTICIAILAIIKMVSAIHDIKGLIE